MTKTAAWLYAFRLRTLPLAFSSIITGSAAAWALYPERFSSLTFGLCLLTTLLLQILSNLANDYGDGVKGTDNDERIGPKRAIQAGLLSVSEMRTGVIICSVLALASGTFLSIKATEGLQLGITSFFVLLGLAAVVAAIKYTVGKDAYGYTGWGDLFVLLFFGFVGVGGSYFLLAHAFDWSILLMGLSIGAFATGVLNLNNMRDHVNDEKAGKRTMVVKMGLAKAKGYHQLLIFVGFMAAIAYVVINFVSTMQFLFIVTAPLFRRHLVAVKQITAPKDFDPHLKQLAIATFIFSILFALGAIIGRVS